jgi:4'-phosphopantetheinyl transferase
MSLARGDARKTDRRRPTDEDLLRPNPKGDNSLTESWNDEALSSGIAHVRWLVLDEVPETAWPIWFEILDEGERARCDRFRREADRQQFIAAHALLRGLLSWAAGASPRSWRFVTGSHGKPALHPDHRLTEITFNISHTDGAVACGLAPGCPIGIDIEREDRAGGHVEIAESYFAPSEVSRLRAATAAERPALFVQLWTLKEAFVKASGQGLSMPLDRFAVSLAPIAVTFTETEARSAKPWRFESLPCTHRHWLSVALQTEQPMSVLSRRISFDEVEQLLQLSKEA